MITQASTVATPLTFDTWDWQGHTICYSVSGEGQPIVLIHGFGASIRHWRKNIPVLAAAGYQVFAIDLLGFGKSAKPPLTYSLELWQELLRDFCQTHMQRPAVFVGNSIGALLAMMMMADYPELASAGVLLNAAGGLNHRPEELNLPLRLVMGTFSKLVGSPWLGSLMFNQVRRRSRIRETLKQVYRDRTAITDELVDILYEPSCDPGAQQVFASILTAPAGPRPSELLPRIHQPLLVMWGEADPWTPISGASLYQSLAHQDNGQVQFRAIPNAGHCPHDECPDQVNALMLEWLQGLSSVATDD